MEVRGCSPFYMKYRVISSKPLNFDKILLVTGTASAIAGRPRWFAKRCVAGVKFAHCGWSSPLKKSLEIRMSHIISKNGDSIMVVKTAATPIIKPIILLMSISIHLLIASF